METATQDQLQNWISRYAAKIQPLPDKPEETLEAVVRALWLFAAGIPASAVRALAFPLPALDETQSRKLEALLEQRSGGTPLAHLTGRQQFMGLEFIASSQALIPRKETEIVAQAVQTILTENFTASSGVPAVLDLCTGSGNLACAIAAQFPRCTVFASDLSPEAVELASANARQLGLLDRIQLFAGDLFGPFQAGTFNNYFDLIVCNPPYITSAKLPSLHPEIICYEPKLAFDAGPLGLQIIWRLIQEAPRFLKDGGWLAFETGAGQGAGLVQRLSRLGHFTNVRGIADGKGLVRAVAAQHRHAVIAPGDELLA